MIKIDILGVKINKISKNKTLSNIGGFLESDYQHYIVTPNPEIVLAAQNDLELKKIINRADIAIPDGIGLKFAGLAMKQNLTRITGADLTVQALKIIKDKEVKFSIVNCTGISSQEDIENNLNKKFPSDKFQVITIDKYKRGDSELEKHVVKSIQTFQPQILFSALGSPFQEKFIYKYMDSMPSVKVALGVGGSFDFLVGNIERAPKPMRSLGLEWLWRLIKEPSRIKRIINAVIIFPVKFIIWRISSTRIYK